MQRTSLQCSRRLAHESMSSAEALARQTREQAVSGYLRLSRDAIDAAVWLKRYVEAAAPDAAQEVG